jgi:hypothetical protein
MEPTTNSSHNRIKITVISAGIVLLGAGLTAYGLSAYSNGLWPFPAKMAAENTNDEKKSVNGKLDRDPTIRKVGQNEVLNVRPAIKSTTQGDCVLTITGNGEKYEYKNSTKGTEGILGCLEFNVDASQIKPGTYNMEIVFTSDTETSKVSETLVVK